jgi:hypothetical protein
MTNSDIETNTSPKTGQSLVSYVHQFIASLRYTKYKVGGGIFDRTRGIYELDCSHYVDTVLKITNPLAYSNLVYTTGAEAPDSQNYYDFFAHLSSHFKNDWNKIDNAKDLEPGDILVFRYTSKSGRPDGGHVMLVMDKPVPDNDALMVQVSDSAYAGHSDDTRPEHDSGVGIGTLLLKIDQASGHPFAYAWDMSSPWQDRVDIDMGRPVDLG